MNILKSAVLAVALASPVAAMAQTTGSPGGATPSADPDKAERDRPQGGSTAGANGRQDPTIKLNHGTPENAKASTGMRHSNTAASDQRGRTQGGSTAGANGAQDPTIKSDSAAQQPQAPK